MGCQGSERESRLVSIRLRRAWISYGSRIRYGLVGSNHSRVGLCLWVLLRQLRYVGKDG